MEIKGLIFHRTCSVCPEQYDVLDSSGKTVGYVRLRWGGLTCEYPDVWGKIIYSVSIGDGLTGTFENDEQRMFHLEAIADKILEMLRENEEE